MRSPHTVVVGGSRGIGRAAVERFASEGHRVSVLSRTFSDPISDEGPIRHFPVDLADSSQLDSTLTTVAEQGGPFSSLLFLQRYRGPGGGDDWKGEIEVSLSATKQVIQRMTADRPPRLQGSVVLVSSFAAEFVADEQPLSYHVAKAAANQMMRYYASTLGPTGVRVNAVCPGAVFKEEAREFYRDNPVLADTYALLTPLRRMCSPEDVANAIMFLCSGQASFVTGQTLVVDGGMSLAWPGSLARRVAEASSSSFPAR